MRPWQKLGAHLVSAGRRGRHGVCRLGAPCATGFRGGRLQRLGRPAPPDALACRVWRVGDFPAWRGRGGAVQVRDCGRPRAVQRQGRPLCAPQRRAARQRRLGVRGRTCPRRLDAGRHFAAARARPRCCAHCHLRGARRFLAAAGRPDAGLGLSGGDPGALRRRPRFHAHRTAAGQRAPVLWLLGLPAHWPVRAHRALRLAGGIAPIRRHGPRGRTEDHPGLGARRISRRTRTGWPASTAPRCTSTPTRARAFTATGTR